MINRKIIISLLLLFSLISIFIFLKEGNNNNEIESEIEIIDLPQLTKNLEEHRILFDSSIEYFSRVDRIKTIEIGFADSNNYILALLNPGSIPRRYRTEKDSLFRHLDANFNYKKCINFVDTLIDIFKISKINFMFKYPTDVYCEDSTWLEFETYLYDSSFYDLKQKDKNYFDHSYYIDGGINLDTMKEKRYYYVLIYKYKDELNSKRFKELVNYRTVNKIKEHWYYYRSYEPYFSNEYFGVNWENYYQFLKTGEICF